jgi:hypothetical protein
MAPKLVAMVMAPKVIAVMAPKLMMVVAVLLMSEVRQQRKGRRR